ncbi:MAG: MBOAT family protein [Ruminococcus flavefaciens]|nr:MBOAT family protein [Ruminococcus flavefaciens]
MQFVSVYFIILLLFLLIGYYVIPGKYRYLFLLICNIMYYLSWLTNFGSAFALISVILVTWIGAQLLEKTTTGRKIILITTILLTLGSLLYFKYAAFLVDNIAAILKTAGIETHTYAANLLMPIGISFFTFQSLSYVFEVYNKKMYAERNLLLYAAYVTFFPTILSGPIESPHNLLEQIKHIGKIRFQFENIQNGIVLFLTGAWIKYVITDRFSIMVNTIFESYLSFGSVILCFGAICYTFQIYCDFLSYSLIASGLGRMLGITLTENFNSPYFSVSIQDFWHRWHISLSTWLRNYVYIPLGGSRCSSLRKNFNLFVTFLVSGIWHGANWTYIIWGILHGLYQIIGNVTAPFRKWIYNHLQVKQDCFSFRLGQRICTFVLVSFAWIFFRTDSLYNAFGYISRMLSEFDIWNLFNDSVYNLGLDILQMNILMASFCIFLFVDYIRYKTNTSIDIVLSKQNLVFRWIVVILLFVNTLIFGMYGPGINSSDFIYFQF